MKAKLKVQFQIPYSNKFINKGDIVEVVKNTNEGVVVYYNEMYIIIPNAILEEVKNKQTSIFDFI